jgi:hypothetical protein
VIRLPRFAHRGRQPAQSARLYVRAGCGLCDEAARLLRPLERNGRLSLAHIDIESDPELRSRYLLTIPVLEIAPDRILAWPFDQAAVEAALW